MRLFLNLLLFLFPLLCYHTILLVVIYSHLSNAYLLSDVQQSLYSEIPYTCHAPSILLYWHFSILKSIYNNAIASEIENVTGLDVEEELIEVTEEPFVKDGDKDITHKPLKPAVVTSPKDVSTEAPTDVGAKLEDKCSSGLHDCSTNGTCIPLEGSFDCECNAGFEGDGRICAGMFVHVLYSFIESSCRLLWLWPLNEKKNIFNG